MIDFERFKKNISIAHLAVITGNDETVLNIIRGLLLYFPNAKDDIEHYFFFTNFGLLESHEQTVEEFYYELLKTNK